MTYMDSVTYMFIIIIRPFHVFLSFNQQTFDIGFDLLFFICFFSRFPVF